MKFRLNSRLSASRRLVHKCGPEMRDSMPSALFFVRFLPQGLDTAAVLCYLMYW